MASILIGLCASAFLIMGCAALFEPTQITRHFAVPELPRAMRNEVRAVYGGFGIAIAGVLAISVTHIAIRPGVLYTVAAAVAGMAFGRLVSLSIERAIDAIPLLFLVIELLLACMLIIAANL